MIWNNEVMFLVVLWLGLSYLGLPKNWFPAQNWYAVKHFDKLIHFIAGLVIASFMLSNGYIVNAIILVNLVLAILWEPLQIMTKNMFNLKGIGFPDAYGDIAFHMTGTVAYLKYAGAL